MAKYYDLLHLTDDEKNILTAFLKADELSDKKARVRVFEANTIYQFGKVEFILSHSLVRSALMDAEGKTADDKEYFYTVFTQEDNKKLGAGGGGRAYDVTGDLRYIDNNLEFFPVQNEFIKIIPYGYDEQSKREQFQNERTLTRLANPPAGTKKLRSQKKDGVRKNSFIRGEKYQRMTLTELLKEWERNPPSSLERLDLSIKLMEALADLHVKGIIHRDLKPDNIIVKPEQPLEVKIIDFGLATRINSGKTVPGGTTFWVPPEAAQPGYNNRLDQPSYDAFQMGLILREVWGENQQADKHKANNTNTEIKFLLDRAATFQKKAEPEFLLGQKVPDELMRTLTQLSHPHPDSRVTISDAVQNLRDTKTNLQQIILNQIDAYRQLVSKEHAEAFFKTKTTKGIKLSALNKLDNKIQGHPAENFTDKELDALMDKNGRLRTIVNNINNHHYLPDQIKNRLRQETAANQAGKQPIVNNEIKPKKL